MGTAAYYGDVGRVRDLLDAGVDPNALSLAGYPFITEAASGGQLEVMEILYEAGADPAALTSEGNTAFYHLANGPGDVAIAVWLLEHGADPCLPVIDSVLPLTDESLVAVATLRRHLDLADWLREVTKSC